MPLLIIDFQKSRHYKTITELADHVASDVLPRLVTEEDTVIFRKLIKELDDSMDKIRLVERERSKYTNRLSKVIQLNEESTLKAEHGDELLEELLYNATKEKLELVENEKEKLLHKMDELTRECKRLVTDKEDWTKTPNKSDNT